jgi:hypothetical protein
MQYFHISPEAPVEVGEHTVMDRSVHPPLVSRLHYVFVGWLGDALSKLGVTGARFANVAISTDYPFEERYPGRVLPPFLWLQVHGQAGVDDFGIAPVRQLMVSERALRTLAPHGIEHAIIEPFDRADDTAR